ncbi:FIST C-terminal domain-containing protein [Shewanella metallivivens]|uniref:FIST C-terminal domain-containing protein n=1 Tax=Shewanella metallivivens TaxID=2872342 RepID=A0ABT5TI75_9GAMM|nr:FIST C-terminal domain-containing protein [Shewanella metallivivens]MDD8058249.1 FIST C-terminal domain-containing protein [Shewanella metallivivens]
MTAIFTNIEFLDDATEKDVVALIAQTVSKDAQYILVVIGSQSTVSIESIPAIAATTSVPVNACVIPGVVFGRHYSYSGTLILGFKGPVTSLLIPDIGASHEVLCQQLQQFVATNGTYGSAGIFVDGLSHAVEPFIATVYENLGSDRILIGAGVGDLNHPTNVSIANEQGCYRNAAIIFCYSNSFKLQVEGKHDLPQVAGPYLVTEASANLIHSLNYQPAAAVFSDAISAVRGIEISQDEIVQHIHSYPFGLKQLNEEYLVRDIIAVNGNSLLCVGNVAENSLVYILNATQDILITAASDAGKQFSQKLLPATADQMRYVVLIDCISRALYLGNDYQLELDAICEQLPEGKILAGVLSIGEIKNTCQGAIQFLNKTIVLGGL